MDNIKIKHYFKKLMEAISELDASEYTISRLLKILDVCCTMLERDIKEKC